MKNRIKDILSEQGRSQVWLAGKLSITPQHLNMLLNSGVDLRLMRAVEIAVILGVELKDIYEEQLND